MNDENLRPHSHRNMEKHGLGNHLKKRARSNFSVVDDDTNSNSSSPMSPGERKRRLTGNTPKESKSRSGGGPKWQPPDEGCCHFCYTQDKTRELGELRSHEGIVAHHSCLVSGGFGEQLCGL